MGQWQSQAVCTSPACIHAAANILQNMAPNWAQMDPCTEFDKMVCSGFQEHNGEDTNPSEQIDHRNYNIMRQILESTSEAQAAGIQSTFLLTARSNQAEDNFDLLQAGWKACMDTQAMATAGIKPLSAFLTTVNQTWPVSPLDLNTTVSESDYDGLHEAALLLEKVGITALHSNCFSEGPIIADYLNSKSNRLCFKTPRSVQNGSAYASEESRKNYRDSMARAFHLTYTDLSEDAATALSQAVINLELAIYPVVSTIPQTDDYIMLKNVSLADLAANAPAVGLDKLVAAITPAGQTPATILLEAPDAWPAISAVIAKQPRAAVQAFMLWKAIAGLAQYVEAPELEKALSLALPVDTTTARWKRCITDADSAVRHVLDHYYVSAAYADLTLKAADKMTTNLRARFKERIGELEWMSDEAKKLALEKIDNMQKNIGFPTANPDLRSPDSLASFYAGLNMTTGSHFNNMLSALQHTTLRQYAAVATPPDRGSFHGPATIVNAFYDPTTNAMVVPAGISQLPWFHYSLPDYAQYGAIGAIIGHELTHGFDSKGRLFDQNAERRDWWDNSTVASFTKRAQCFIDQFDAIAVDVPGGKAHVNGTRTLAENLADAGGLHTAFDAWQADRKVMPSVWDQDLPGLEAFKFTHEQLFYVVYGNVWCDSSSPATMVTKLLDEHTPSMARLRANTMNSRGFREAWGCPVKEPTCELW